MAKKTQGALFDDLLEEKKETDAFGALFEDEEEKSAFDGLFEDEQDEKHPDTPANAQAELEAKAFDALLEDGKNAPAVPRDLSLLKNLFAGSCGIGAVLALWGILCLWAHVGIVAVITLALYGALCFWANQDKRFSAAVGNGLLKGGLGIAIMLALYGLVDIVIEAAR